MTKENRIKYITEEIDALCKRYPLVSRETLKHIYYTGYTTGKDDMYREVTWMDKSELDFTAINLFDERQRNKFESAIGVYRFVGGFRNAYQFLLNQLVKVKREILFEIFDENETKGVFDYNSSEEAEEPESNR
jgi:hypothetical protein